MWRRMEGLRAFLRFLGHGGVQSAWEGDDQREVLMR